MISVKVLKRVLVKCLFVAVVLQADYSAGHAQKLKPSLEPFRCLLGSWSFVNVKGRTIEIWKYRDSAAFISRSYRIDINGDSTLLETVLLKAEDLGVFYIPIVENQNNKKPIRFKLVATANKKYVFENKKHDFPQRVIYKVKGENKLLAWIEGEKNGRLVKSEFLYRREK